MSTVSSFPTAIHENERLADAIAARAQALDSIEERRRWPRSALPVTTTLRSMAGVQIPALHTDNLSEGGLRATVPIGFGVAVGQRYEVLLYAGGASGAAEALVGDGHYGTVVRTEIMLGTEGADDRVGVGLRFDTPILL